MFVYRRHHASLPYQIANPQRVTFFGLILYHCDRTTLSKHYANKAKLPWFKQLHP